VKCKWITRLSNSMALSIGCAKMEPRKQAIIAALRAFMNQRSGIEFGNYGDVKSFRAEQRSITKDLHQARELMRAVELSDSITANDLLVAAKGAFSGRLTITLKDHMLAAPAGVEWKPELRASIDYCTGQYFPTEYRRAVCAVLASALWEHTREHCMPPVYGYRVESWSQLGKGRALHTVVANRKAAELQLKDLGGSGYGHVNAVYMPGNGRAALSAGDWLRTHFCQQFGRGIASRWFS